MSSYIYAIIPYKKKDGFVPDPGEQSCWFPNIPELANVQSELAEQDGLALYPDFLMINTCYRQNSLCNCEDGYSWLRAEIYKIVKVLDAEEAWYIEELITQDFDAPNFSFEEWKKELATTKSRYVKEMTVDVLKSNYAYSYYHDVFSDIILDRRI